ncbi:MAG TPA: FecR family protein [Polyangia bacterium]|nr:FecR family protein [Polyangia bacterium]
MSDQRLDRLDELARAAAAAGATQPQPGRASPTWEEFVVARAADERGRRRRGVVLGIGGAAALLAVVASVGGKLGMGIGGLPWGAGHSAPLSFTLDEGAVTDRGYISRVHASRAVLKFSDGTEVTLQHGSRAWVVSTDAQGGRVRLEEGQAHFAVVPRPGARWVVEAGPYTIDVTGTRFDVAWAGGDDLFEVRLVSGAVTVRGPLTGDGIKLSPGQQFRGRLSEGAVGIQRVASAARSDEPPASSPPTAASTITPAPPVAQLADVTAGSRRTRSAVAMRASDSTAAAMARQDAPGESITSVGTDWRKQVARGQFHVVVRDAEDAGIDRCLASLPADRLTALADAARYTARTELARRVLVAQRQRFSGSAAAHDAAFLLGRLAEDTGAPLPSALDWYDRYLLEAPRGSYAAEALGRKMLALTRMPGATTGATVARDYLLRYPNGQYVTQARGILESGR